MTGYLLCAFTVPMALAAIPGGWLSSRLGYRWSVVFGLVIAIVGFLMMSVWKVEMAGQAVSVLRTASDRDPDPPPAGHRHSWRSGLRSRESASD